MSSGPVVALLPPPPPPHIDISSTFGATLIGSFIAMMLYGLTTLQTYLYYTYYPKDWRSTKILVAVIWVLDTLHAAFMAYSIYFYLVISYVNPNLLGVGHWTIFVSVALNALIACIAQTFFLARIHRLCSPTYRRWVTSLIGLAVLAHFAFGIETVAFLFIKRDLARLSEIRLIAATPFAISAVISDVMIASALCCLLHGSRSGLKRGSRTDTIISALIVYAINRCLLTSVVAVVEIIVYSTAPESLWFLAIDFLIGKLYANSLLATLNGRAGIRAANLTTANSIHLSELEFESSTATATKPQVRNLALDIGAESARQHTPFPAPIIGPGSTLEEGLVGTSHEHPSVYD